MCDDSMTATDDGFTALYIRCFVYKNSLQKNKCCIFRSGTRMRSAANEFCTQRLPRTPILLSALNMKHARFFLSSCRYFRIEIFLCFVSNIQSAATASVQLNDETMAILQITFFDLFFFLLFFLSFS